MEWSLCKKTGVYVIMKRITVRLSALVMVLFLCSPQAARALEDGRGEGIPAVAGEERTMRLSLQSAVELGIERNLDVVIEKYREEVAAEKIREEKSIFDPVSTLSVDTGREEQPIAEVFYDKGYIVTDTDRGKLGVTGKVPTGATLGLDFSFEKNESTSQVQTMSPRYTSRLNLSLVHPLLKDFGIGITKTRIRLAEKESEIARHDVKDQVMHTVGAVEQAYWDLTYAIENVILKRQDLDLAKKLFYESEIKVRAGEIPPMNVIQARAGLAAREEEMIIAESEAAKAQYDLKLLLDVPDNGVEILPISHPEKTKELPDVSESLKAALENHPKLKATKVELQQQDIRLRYAKNQLMPRLDLIANYGFNGLSGDPNDLVTGYDSLGNPITPGDDVQGTVFEGKESPRDAFDNYFSKDGFETWLLGMKLEMPWGNRQAKSRYTQAALDQKRTKTELRRLEEQIGSQVKKAILDIRAAIKRMEATGIAVELNQKQLDAEETRFLAGEATSSDVLRFQEDLTDMKTKELKAVIDYNTAWSTLRMVQGLALEKYGIEFDLN
jgi:outer membrane protein TolC